MKLQPHLSLILKLRFVLMRILKLQLLLNQKVRYQFLRNQTVRCQFPLSQTQRACLNKQPDSVATYCLLLVQLLHRWLSKWSGLKASVQRSALLQYPV